MRGSRRDRIVGGEQGGGQGLAKRSHFISQGSPFAPPPPPIHPPSLSCSRSLPFPTHSWNHRGRSRSSWTGPSVAHGFQENVLLNADPSCSV